MGGRGGRRWVRSGLGRGESMNGGFVLYEGLGRSLVGYPFPKEPPAEASICYIVPFLPHKDVESRL